jgi:zinc transporter 2
MKNSQVLLIRYFVESINVRAAFIHVLGDLFQSIGVIIAAIIIKVKPEWGIVDPICTFIFCVIVLITTFGIIRDCIKVLMEGVPFGINTNTILNDLMKVL